VPVKNTALGALAATVTAASVHLASGARAVVRRAWENSEFPPPRAGVFFCPKHHLTSPRNYAYNFGNSYLFFGYILMAKTEKLITTEEFTEALDAAFASVTVEDLNKMLESWGENEKSVRTRLISQFNSWPDAFKDFDLENMIDVDISEPSVGRHQFLSFQYCGVPEGTDLSGIDLRDVYLGLFTLIGVTLKGGDLRGVDLRGAEMNDTNLEGARLEGVRLDGADLKGAKGLVVDKDKNQNSKLTFGHDTGTVATGTVTIDEHTELPSDLLCCYFNSALYPKNKSFIENPTTFAEWAKNFNNLFQDSSSRIVTPPQSRLNLEVSGDINEWVLAMLPRLEDAWNKREQDPTRLEIQKFFNNLKAGPQQG
jgi:hypothetical protein